MEFSATIGNLLGSIFLLSLFYTSGSTLGGWSWEASLIVLGIYTLLESVIYIILQPNLSRIVRHVQNGTLDFVLLKPVDSQLWLSFRVVSPWGIPSFLAGICLIFYGLATSNINLSIGNFLWFSLLMLNSLAILYSLWFLLATTSIWFVKIWNVTEVLRSTLVAGRYPIYAYPFMLRAIFTFVIPIAFLTTFPAEAILGYVSTDKIIASVAVSIISIYFTRWFWRYALRFYTSASS
ncbi:ABC transporter permease [Prochlorococcus sp. MIT 1300]|uniref:ABC transporter permease n=1 Tax=Prochlorococcus sp. MIT 1300 TaxID=3096218 RepID=UPI002A75F743|nr:ABC-2 family transporter protein [Prochlorococcus sp. MIT 1300]